MLYPFLTTHDGVEISYSEPGADNSVRVFVEQWNDELNDFNSLEVYLPERRVTQQVGFSAEEVATHLNHIFNLQDVILECAGE